jgi:predicted RNase H-like HicB family nuclease
MEMNLAYGVAVNRDEDGRHVVVVRDLPEVCTDGETKSEALANAAEAITAVLLAKVGAGDPVAVPTSVRENEVAISPEKSSFERWLIQ